MFSAVGGGPEQHARFAHKLPSAVGAAIKQIVTRNQGGRGGYEFATATVAPA